MADESNDFIRNKEQKVASPQEETDELIPDDEKIDVREFAQETHGNNLADVDDLSDSIDAALDDDESLEDASEILSESAEPSNEVDEADEEFIEDVDEYFDEENDAPEAEAVEDELAEDEAPEAETSMDDSPAHTAEFPAITDEIPEEEPEQDAVQDEEIATQQDVKPKKKRRGLKALLIALIVIVILALGCTAALAIDDHLRTQEVPANTTLDGDEDISSLTSDELRRVLDKRIEKGKASYLTLNINGESEKLKMNSLGTPNADDTIEAAFAPYNKEFYLRWKDRIETLFDMKEQPSYEVNTYYDLDEKKLKKRIKAIAQDINVEAKQATYEYDSKTDGLVKVAGKTGIKLNVKKTIKAIKDAYSSEESNVTVTAVCEVTQPKKDLNQAILVDTSACRLRFYQGTKVVFDWPCTPGKSGYSTPTGSFTIVDKQYMPTWINPHSDWSEGMAETIGPGESNPLGLRALGLSCGGGIFIHGTTNTYQLGSQGSHGCIRLANANVVKLFDKVKLNCPVIVR